ncbi:hypothetical protein TNCV_3269351 [Trichonephila clavipes]|nr:hypothetical protein TNCV_3269351 [Trichonephila clavipes]
MPPAIPDWRGSPICTRHPLSWSQSPFVLQGQKLAMTDIIYVTATRKPYERSINRPVTSTLKIHPLKLLPHKRPTLLPYPANMLERTNEWMDDRPKHVCPF